MKSSNDDWQCLARNPKSLYQQLFIKGTRIRAEVLFGLTVDGSEPMTAEEVAQSFELPLAAVLEAIAYCRSEPNEIRLDHEREAELLASNTTPRVAS